MAAVLSLKSIQTDKLASCQEEKKKEKKGKKEKEAEFESK